MLAKSYRISGKAAVARILQGGARRRSGNLLIFFQPTAASHPRLAVVVSRKIDRRAVKRNYLRRFIYHLARAQLLGWSGKPVGDIVLMVLGLPKTDWKASLESDLRRWQSGL